MNEEAKEFFFAAGEAILNSIEEQYSPNVAALILSSAIGQAFKDIEDVQMKRSLLRGVIMGLEEIEAALPNA